MEDKFSFNLKGDSSIQLSEQSSKLLTDFISNLIEVEKVSASNIKMENFYLTGDVPKWS